MDKHHGPMGSDFAKEDHQGAFSCLIFINTSQSSLMRYIFTPSLQVKVQCQKGIPASLRAKCWPLLCGATARMKQNENLYQVRLKN